MQKTFIVLLLALSTLVSHGQSFNELAPTPPMGWNSWNKFGCNVSEDLIKEMADAMVETGMKDAGFEYIVIDDCWQVDRDENGVIVADPDRFPSGMKALADYVHSRGLKFGLYSDAGSATCEGRPGSRGHQFQDARTYAAWGVDYLKYDWCNNEGQNSTAAYKTMRDAIIATGRPIVLSICEWGTTKPWEWGEGIGHLWRTTGDIRDIYKGRVNWGGLGVVDIIDLQVDLWKYAGPGHWNDPDMLEVGNGGMTYDEYVTHFSMWCMLAAPLMAGNDLRNMDEETKTILTNTEAIAVNQDPLGKQGIKFLDMGEREVWVKWLENNEIAVCFFNRSENAWDKPYNWKGLNIYHDGRAVDFKKTTYTIRDLWQHKDTGDTAEPIELDIPPHGVTLVRLTPQ